MGEVIQPIDDYQRVALDTSVFIYALETHPQFSTVAAEILQTIQRGAVLGTTSVISVAELIVGPYQRNDREMAQLYEARLFVFPNLRIIDVRRDIAREASWIRGQYGFLLPDALHLATALLRGADTFITNDRQLQRFDELPVTLISDFIH